MRPRYLDVLDAGEAPKRIQAAEQALRDCRCCPHECGVNRIADEVGICRTGRQALVDGAHAHHGEESCLSGRLGSGTIFFGNCNLGCVFCQNWELSHHGRGDPSSPDTIAALALELQDRGCHNINFVSPGHVVPQVVLAILTAAERGLRLPIVYNSNAYDSLASLQMLDGLVDVYLPDFKFWESATAERLCGARDYPEHTRAALVEMQRQVGPLQTDALGIATRGLLVRHLVLPGLGDESRAILDFLAREVAPATCVNIMDQYRPCFKVGAETERSDCLYADIARRLEPEEFDRIYRYGQELGLNVL